MRSKGFGWKALLLVCVLVCGFYTAAGAEGLSNDNSLSSLGILTEGAEVSPEFGYGVTEYDVTVPEGTQELELDPVTSNENAWIVDISGTQLTDGETTVEIIVSAESGEQFPYYLHVTASGAAAGGAQTEEAQTEQAQTESETETEPETEDPRYVRVDRNSLEEANNTIEALKTEVSSYRDRVGILMRILYGMIAFCVVLLFVVINLVLKKKDMKAELNEYRSFGYPPSDAGYPDAQDAGAYSQGADYGQSADYGQEYDQYGQPYDYQEQDFADAKPESRRRPEAKRDDPETVPKPSKAKKKPKKMPEYQQPETGYTYQQPPQGKGKDKNVEITMIDL